MNRRLHEAQRQSCTTSSFFLRTPLRVMTWLPQYGHAPGGLLVCGAVAGRSGERDIRGRCAGERITGHEFWKMKSRILEGRGRLAGHEYWTVGAQKQSRILRGMAAGFEREGVSDFGRDRARKVSNRAASGVPVARREGGRF